MKRANPLRLERLEDRTTPSTVTLSFVPDGTQVGALQSELYHFYSGVSPAVWQQSLLTEIQSAISPIQPGVTLALVPDDGASMNAPAPQDGAIRIAAVNELFTSTGAVVYPPVGQDFMVAGGATYMFGTGLGLVGPNGQPLSPTPQSGGSTTLLPLSLPIKAYGNLYPTTPSPTPPLTPSPSVISPDGMIH